MKIDVKRVISKFQLEVSQTAQEAAALLIHELLFDLKILNLRQPYKISKIIPFKDKLIEVKLEETEDLIHHFNTIINTFFENYMEQRLKWNKPNIVDFKIILLKELKKESKELNIKLFEVSVTATSLRKDLNFLKINYKINNKSLDKIEILISKLKTMTKINYQTVVSIIKLGKLPTF